MRKTTSYPFVGIVLLYGLLSTGWAASTQKIDASSVPSSIGPSISAETEEQQSPESALFFAAKSSFFDSKWKEAKAGFEDYLKQYPNGRMRNEALFWLAQSINNLSWLAPEVPSVIRLKEEALRRVEELLALPKNSWTEDGRDLRTGIAAELGLLGKETGEKPSSEIRQKSLSALVILGKSALPYLRKTAVDDPDPSVRRQAVVILAQSYFDESRDLLAKIGESDPDSYVKSQAAHSLALRQSPIASVLSTMMFSSAIFSLPSDSPEEKTRFPEGKILQLSLPWTFPPSGYLTKDYFQNAISGLFPRGARELKAWFWPKGSVGHSREISIVKIESATLIDVELKSRKADAILGRLRIKNLQTGRVHDSTFLAPNVRRSPAILQVFRDGNELLMIAMGAIGDFPSSRRSPSADISREPEIPYGSGSTVFNDVEGWTLSSPKSAWTDDELESKAEIIDFGSARMEDYPWEIRGEILYIPIQHTFVAKKANLTFGSNFAFRLNCDFRIPAGDPFDFTILTPEQAASPLKPVPSRDVADFAYTPRVGFFLDNHVRLRLERDVFSLIELNARDVYYGKGRADVQAADGVWTVYGDDLSYSRGEHELRAQNGILLNPEGKIVFRGSSVVLPLQTPSAYRGRKMN